jgi:hypothetical protein
LVVFETFLANFGEFTFHELRRYRSELGTPVGTERERLGSSNPRKRSTHL